MKRALLDEPPLLLLPSLACAVGVIPALLLQQLHYWLQWKIRQKSDKDPGWIWNSARQWQEQFPFLTEKTIREDFKKLERLGVVRSKQAGGTLRAKSYQIDYAALEVLVERKQLDPAKPPMFPKREHGSAQQGNMEVAEKGTCYTKTTKTETTTETVHTPPEGLAGSKEPTDSGIGAAPGNFMARQRKPNFDWAMRHIAALGGDVEIMCRPEKGGAPITRRHRKGLAGKDRSFLTAKSRDGWHIYVLPATALEHGFVLLDDLSESAAGQLADDGLTPAVLIETSPANFQAWLKLADSLDYADRKGASALLTDRYHADAGAVGAYRWGRLAGFRNTKPEHKGPGGYPFSEIRSLGPAGQVCKNGPTVIAEAQEVETKPEKAKAKKALRAPQGHSNTAPFPTPSGALKNVSGNNRGPAIAVICARYARVKKRKGPGTGWNEADFGAVAELLKAGVDPIHAEIALFDSLPKSYALGRKRKSAEIKYCQRTLQAVKTALNMSKVKS